MIYEPKNRIVIVCGHYGCGKTNVAVNLALGYKRSHPQLRTALADVDTVNPYFRAADAADCLLEAGVIPVIPEFANSNVDIPSLPAELYSLFRTNSEVTAFIDVGGDDGAVALGMYADDITACGYDMLYVVSRYRPMIESPEAAADLMGIIEEASHLKCTGIVNNSSIGAETTAEDITASIAYAEECARQCRLPLLFTSYYEKLIPDLSIPGQKLFPMKNVTRQMF